VKKPDGYKIAVIVVAGGSGVRAARFEKDLPKQYRKLNGVAVLAHSINSLLDMDLIDWVLPVIAKEHQDYFLELELSHEKLLGGVFGGADRQASSLAGLEALETIETLQEQTAQPKTTPDLVLIHDGARPFISKDLVERICQTLQNNDGVLPAINLSDTIKLSRDGKNIAATLNRSELWAAQTPQGFHFQKLLNIHKRASTLPQRFTDDTSLAEWGGLKVVLVEGEESNFKITRNSDFSRAKTMFKETKFETRTGSGLDIHQFEPGDKLRLGGVDIAHDFSLKGHSDADAALHVLTDALLGAIAAGDIGTHFPPSDKKWQGEPSDTFLRFATNKISQKGGRIVHLDLTIVCEMPKIAPHVQNMRKNIAAICSIAIGRVSIKATTSEKMGFIGRSEGLMTLGSATVELPYIKTEEMD